MRKTKYMTAVVMICILTLSGCRCSHAWDAAACDVPKTCQFCGVTDGAPLGHVWSPATCGKSMFCEICHQTEGKPLSHQWVSATCTTPKTCAVCAAEDGTAIGHMWINATCDSPRCCSLCKLTEGDPLGHSWTAATTEAPKTCSACGKTDGDPITADPRFNIAESKPLFGTWEARRSRTAENIGLTGKSFPFIELTVYIFRNDGIATISTEVENLATCKQAMSEAITDGLCEKYGSKEAADQATVLLAGIPAETYATVYSKAYFAKIENTSTEGVYYVSGDCLFMADSWNSEMTRYQIVLTDGHLTLVDEDNERIELVRK